MPTMPLRPPDAELALGTLQPTLYAPSAASGPSVTIFVPVPETTVLANEPPELSSLRALKKHFISSVEDFATHNLTCMVVVLVISRSNGHVISNANEVLVLCACPFLDTSRSAWRVALHNAPEKYFESWLPRKLLSISAWALNDTTAAANSRAVRV